MNEEKISVLIPCFNTEKFLSKCLDSVINQTYKCVEIIVLNDGSTDNSLKIMNEYANKDNRIKVISRENRGVAYSRNELIQNSTGQYIVFVDSDDTIHSEMIYNLYFVAKKENCDLAISKLNRIKDVSELNNNIQIDNGYDVYNKEQIVLNLLTVNDYYDCLCGKLFKKELFNNIEMPNGRVYEDSAVIHRIYCNISKVAVLNGEYYNYLTGRENSITTCSYSYDKLLDNMYVINDRYECLIQNVPDLKNEITLGYIRNILALIERSYLSHNKALIDSKEVRYLCRLLNPLYHSIEGYKNKSIILTRFKLACLFLISNEQMDLYENILKFVYEK